VVAHEIRNPLMIIKTALRGLKTQAPTPTTVTAAVTDIEEEVSRLNRIVSEVLDFARPIKFELAPADVNEICRDAARAVDSETPVIPVRIELDRSIPAAVTDAERLRQALVNILTNARHAVIARNADTAPADAVRLRTLRLGPDRIAIDVRDRGTGIAADDLPRVFDPYFTTRRTGTGLGLAISRNIIEGLGGTVAVSSRPGDGTEVRIELPATSEHAHT
jgi:two-component system sensor histidine kinase HydH